MHLLIPQKICAFAVHQLATVDHSVANVVTRDVSRVVDWSFAHDVKWLAIASVDMLQTFDDLGSFLISMVVWLMHHSV